MAALTEAKMLHWNMTDEGSGIWSKTPYNNLSLSPAPETFYIKFDVSTSEWYLTNSAGSVRLSVTWTDEFDLRNIYETLIGEPLNEFSR